MKINWKILRLVKRKIIFFAQKMKIVIYSMNLLSRAKYTLFAKFSGIFLGYIRISFCCRKRVFFCITSRNNDTKVILMFYTKDEQLYINSEAIIT